MTDAESQKRNPRFGQVQIAIWGTATGVFLTVAGAVASFLATGDAAGAWFQIGTVTGLAVILIMGFAAIAGGAANAA